MRTATRPWIAYDDGGHGEPALVFLPGWAVGRSFFREVAASASRRRRTLALDWRGHGESEDRGEDYTSGDLVDDTVRVLKEAQVERAVPVAQSHGGWMALELRRRLGGARIPGLITMSWMVFGPPPGFGDALQALRDPAQWEAARDALIERWTAGSDEPSVRREGQLMRGYPHETWARAGREIAASFAAEQSPLAALERLDPPCPTLHLYAQPGDEAFLHAQQQYAATHPWFHIRRLAGRSHFPALEAAEEVAAAAEEFVTTVEA